MGQLFYFYIPNISYFISIENNLLRLGFFWDGLGRNEQFNSFHISSGLNIGEVVIARSGANDNALQILLINDNNKKSTFESIKRAGLKEIDSDKLIQILQKTSVSLRNVEFEYAIERYFKEKVTVKKYNGGDNDEMYDNFSSKELASFAGLDGSGIKQMFYETSEIKGVRSNRKKKVKVEKPEHKSPIDDEFLRLAFLTQTNRWPARQLINVIDCLIKSKEMVDDHYSTLRPVQRSKGKATLLNDESISIIKTKVNVKLFIQNF